LQKSPNVVVNYNWVDLKNPDQRKASFSQTLKLPFSNRNNEFFENWFDVNLDALVFNTNIKFNAILYVDSIPQLKGFIELKSIYLNARLYECALFGATADFFTDIKDNKLQDAFRTQDEDDPDLYLEDDSYDHTLSLANALASWTSPGLTTVGGSTTNDIMYPIIDYGHTDNPYSTASFWNPADIISEVNTLGDAGIIAGLNHFGGIKLSDLKPAIRIQTLFHLIAKKAKFQIKSTFLGIDDTNESTPITDTQWFSRLFMTCSTENTRVQSLFNTSSGSEAPFVGFRAEMTSAQTQNNMPITFPDWLGYGSDAFDSLVVDNEIYDPNGLYSSTTTLVLNVFEEVAGVSLDIPTPSIQIPTDPIDAAMLPTGTLPFQTTINITIPALTNEGNSYTPTLYMKWFNQADLDQQAAPEEEGGELGTYNVFGLDPVSTQEFAMNPGTTETFTTVLNLVPEPGVKYFLIIQVLSGESDVTQTINMTVNSCVIETLMTDGTGLMNGGEGGIVQMYHNMPDITQADFVKDLVNRFNLIIKTDEDNERLLLIEPYQDFIDAGTTKYWTDKLDVSKEQVVKSTNELQSRRLEFKDSEGEDLLNARYTERYNVVYGQYNRTYRNDFAKETFENFSVFSPFIAQGMPYWNVSGISGNMPQSELAVAYLFEAEIGEESEPISTMTPKLFYYGGTPETVGGVNPITNNSYEFHLYSNQFLETSESLSTGNTFPLCTQYNLDNLNTGVTSDTKIIHWTWYNPAFNTGFTFNYFGDTVTEHGLFFDYYAQYINEIYDPEARMMECYLNLSPTDIRSFAGSGFQNTYYIKNTLWRIVSISNYLVGGDKSTKVTLIKVIEKLPNNCGAISTIGVDGLMSWVDSATGLSTTITNVCCEEQNSDWTFVETNSSTGVGNCYATGGDFVTTMMSMPMPNFGYSGTLPASMKSVQNNFNITTTNGIAKNLTFYLQATTLNDSESSKFNYNGVQSQIFKVSLLTMNYVKVSILGSIKSGTNVGKVGYFEYDTILVCRQGGYSSIGSTGGELLKTYKDSDFSVPTINITNFTGRGYWAPLIVGGASEIIDWTAKVEVVIQSVGDATITPKVRAIYQNADNILMQNLDYLIWN
jgi:hypothetical protein